MIRTTLNNHLRNLRKDEGGFTLIELLIVIVVLGILAGIVVFGVGTFRRTPTAAAKQGRLQERRRSPPRRSTPRTASLPGQRRRAGHATGTSRPRPPRRRRHVTPLATSAACLLIAS